MSDLEELKSQLAAATARRDNAKLTDDETEHAKLLAQVAEAKAEARAAETARRAILGAKLEADARKKAAGRHLVQYFDLAALLPEAEPEKLPGEGILVLRSPAADMLAQLHREVEAGEQSLVAAYTNLVCSITDYPDLSNHDTGMRFRDFLESPIGCGTVIGIGDAATTLGGTRAKRTKRGRG